MRGGITPSDGLRAAGPGFVPISDPAHPAPAGAGCLPLLPQPHKKGFVRAGGGWVRSCRPRQQPDGPPLWDRLVRPGVDRAALAGAAHDEHDERACSGQDRVARGGDGRRQAVRRAAPEPPDRCRGDRGGGAAAADGRERRSRPCRSRRRHRSMCGRRTGRAPGQPARRADPPDRGVPLERGLRPASGRGIVAAGIAGWGASHASPAPAARPGSGASPGTAPTAGAGGPGRAGCPPRLAAPSALRGAAPSGSAPGGAVERPGRPPTSPRSPVPPSPPASQGGRLLTPAAARMERPPAAVAGRSSPATRAITRPAEPTGSLAGCATGGRDRRYRNAILRWIASGYRGSQVRR